MDETTKNKLLQRLRRAEGQVTALSRMVEEEKDCVDVLTQIAAVRGALAKAGQLLLGQHLETCVRDAFASGDEAVRDRQVDELMDIFGRYGGLPTR
ncbi:MAG: metal-sensitive transcriptional regulator [Thermoanaerobaculia bacterium]